MALTKETAGKIIDVVAADLNCREAIQPKPLFDFLNPGTGLLLELSHFAGSAGNAAMMAQGNYVGDPMFDERICSGIGVVTQNTIFTAIKNGKLLGVQTTVIAHRVHKTFHHQATSTDMIDGSVYIFDWHVTLKLRDPVISKLENWNIGQTGINYLIFGGFD